MSKLKLLYRSVATLCAALFCIAASAQFKSDAFSQQYNSDPAQKDSIDKLFSFKEYFGGLAHKNDLKCGNSFAGSLFIIGGQQIYNKDYWKLPIVYGTILGTTGTGIYLNSRGNHEAAKYCFIGAGVAYWATLLEGTASYKPAEYPHPGKATIYSLLLPGLGQIYNREYWKIPIYLGAMGFGVHYYIDCNKNYNRFRNIYLEASDPESGYSGPVTAQQALYYRNTYRRYRDYALLAIAALYVLQAIDANVFAYMHGFEVSDDLSLKVEPAVIMPDTQLASLNPTLSTNPSFGVRFGLKF